jgi:regulator of extracellular matrix RemA (YlzA/DUF370 family)
MYIHIGGETVLQTGGIVGLFDLDGASQGKGTRDFLRRCEKEGRLVQVRGDALPRSFMVTASDKVYLSPTTTETLYKRLESKRWIG